MSNKETNQASCQTIVSGGRCYGQTHEMVLEIKKTLEQRGECGIGLMKDATDTLKRLKDLGVNAMAEPTYRTMPPIIKRNKFGEPIDLLLNEKVRTGMVFYLCQPNAIGEEIKVSK